MDIFICFAASRGEFAEGLRAALERRGFAAWAGEGEQSGGAERAYDEALESARLVVYVHSEDAIVSPRCLRVVARAEDEGKRVIGVLSQAPDRIPAGWAGYPWVDFTDPGRRTEAEAELEGLVVSALSQRASPNGQFDVFISYTHTDVAAVRPLVAALRKIGLAVWFDEGEIVDFVSITRSIEEGLARSKALLAFYSSDYPARRPCQWEMTAAFLAAQREGDPRARILVINPESGADHVFPVELRDALFRQLGGSTASSSYEDVARRVAEHLAGLQDSLGDVCPLMAPRWLPSQSRGLGSTRFVGRLPEMWQIHSALHAADFGVIAAGTAAVVQVRGLGGVGKSLLVEEYALRFGAAYPGGIVRLRALGHGLQGPTSDEQRTAERDRQMASIASGVGIAIGERTPAEIEAALTIELERRGLPCLWIVDDLPVGLDAESVRAWLSPHPLAKTVVTTRDFRHDWIGHIDLDVLPAEEGYQLLTARRVPADDDEEQAARQIVEQLGGHAQALDVAGAALAVQEGLKSFADFSAALSEAPEDELEVAGQLATALPSGHEPSIGRTLVGSIQSIGSAGLDFLRLAACLAAAPIPAWLVAKGFARVDGTDEDRGRQMAGRAFQEASALALAQQVKDSWSVHVLVSRSMRLTDPDPERRERLRVAGVSILTEELDRARNRPAEVVAEGLVTHACQLAAGREGRAELELLLLAGRYDFARGTYPAALALYRQVLETSERQLGAADSLTLRSRNLVAKGLRALGQLEDSRQVLELALKTSDGALGSDHPHTLSTKQDLAATLWRLGDMVQARRMEEEVLAASLRVFGPEHPRTRTAENNLASTLSALGDQEGARRLLEEVLESAEGALGADAPGTLAAKHNLALTLFELGDLARARELQEEVLDARRQSLGEEHPDTLTAKNNLATTLWRLGRRETAHEMLEEVLATSERVLGPQHPDTLSTRRLLMQAERAQTTISSS